MEALAELHAKLTEHPPHNPPRLRQFGLSPELTQMAGFASLLIATLGLCALNYSSHYALNAYGLACATFIVFILVGIMPDSWQQLIQQQQLSSYQHHLNHANYTSNLTGKQLVLKSADADSARGNLVINLIYFTLLLVLTVLLIFAFILAQHFRRREQQEAELEQQQQHVADCSCELGSSSNNSNQLVAGAQLARPSCANSNFSQSLVMNADCDYQQFNALQHFQHQNYHNTDANLIRRRLPSSFAVQQQQQRRSVAYAPIPRADLSSRSLASLTTDVINSAGLNDDDGDVEVDHSDNEQELIASGQQSRLQNLPPLVSRGHYYTTMTKGDQSSRERLVASETSGNKHSCRRHRNRAINGRPDCRASSQQANYNNKTGHARCWCEPNSSASNLAAKLQSNSFLNSYYLSKSQQYNTMPSKFNLSSVYAIRSTTPAQRMTQAAYSAAAAATSKPKRSKQSGSSVMAMTAAAAAAFLGGVVDPSLLNGNGTGGGGGIMDSNFDDGMPADMADDSGFEMANISGVGHGDDCDMMDHQDDHQHEFEASGLHSRNSMHIHNKPITDFGVMLDTQRE